MSEREAGHEPFWSEVDADDVVESFLGSLAAMLLVTLVPWILMRGGRGCAQQRSR